MRRAFLAGLLLAIASAAAAQPERGEALERAYEEMLAAYDVLQHTQAARELGIEPQPGERLAIGGGRSRLTPEYWERQKRLEDDVELARERLERALARWHEVR